MLRDDITKHLNILNQTFERFRLGTLQTAEVYVVNYFTPKIPQTNLTGDSYLMRNNYSRCLHKYVYFVIPFEFTLLRGAV